MNSDNISSGSDDSNETSIDLDELTDTQDRVSESPVAEIQETSIDIPTLREKTRAKLAQSLLWLLGLTLLGVGAYIVWSGHTKTEKSFHKELITVIWTSQVTLVSGALGFYFGSQQ